MVAFRWIALALVFSPVGGLPAAAGKDDPTESLRKNIESAFRSGSPNPFREICSPRDRIFLSLPGTGIPEGYVSRDQLHFHLERLFAVRKTLRFRFGPVSQSSAQRVQFATARWEYREEEKKEPGSMSLRFGFSRRGENWILSEIRADS